jgi:hypothetical protein
MDRPTCGNLDKIHRSIRASTGFKQVKSAKTICTVEEIDLKGVCLQIVFTAKEDFFASLFRFQFINACLHSDLSPLPGSLQALDAFAI